MLQRVLNVVSAEEAGSAEHITESVSSEEIEDLMNELGITVESTYTDEEIEEMANDFFDEWEPESIDDVNDDNVEEWFGPGLTKSDMKMIVEKVKQKF